MENKKSECFETLSLKYQKNKIKTDIHTLDQIKITLDDFLIEYAKERGYNEKHTITDIQNLVGVISTILASIVGILSYFCKFEDIKSIILFSVVTYFGLNAICFLFSKLKGGKIKFEEFEIFTKIDSTPFYMILLYWKDKNLPVKYHREATDLFYEDGEFDHISFLNDLESLFKEK